MPLRMMHYVASFHDHLMKNGVTTAQRGLPPVFPVVLYNGAKRWTARQDIHELVTPTPPGFLQPYQPHLRYYLIDEGRYSDEELATRNTVLSGIFGIERASEGHEALQRAVDRVVVIIQADPDKERIDRIVTRWIKRHFERLGARVDLTELNSLVEDRNMLADNLENWAKRERQEGGMTKLESTLRKQVTLKFGDMPAWADQRLADASEDELDEWAVRVMTVGTLEVMFAD